MKIEAREKLKEKDIDWKQVYTDKTLFLKEQFEDVIGPGSYFRFEGKDEGSGDEYYCIVGPAKIHNLRAKFFAGVRKLPATYPAGGKYFDSMDAAASYASETWGVSTPKSLKPYTSAQLHDLKKRVTEWKDKRKEDDSDDSKDKEDTKESNCNSGRCIMSSSNQKGKFNLRQHRVAAGLDSDFAGPADSGASRGKKHRKEAPADIQFKDHAELLAEIKERDPKMWDVAYNELMGIERDTGVSKQVGEESIDDRRTISNLSEDGRIALAALINYAEDPDDPNTTWGDYVFDCRFSQPDGSYTIDKCTKVGGIRFRITDGVLAAFVRLMHEKNMATIDESEMRSDRDYMPDDDLQSQEDLMTIRNEIGDLLPESKNVNERQVLSSTVKNLLRIAKDMDENGKSKDAEEVHKVIRKYKEKLGGS